MHKLFPTSSTQGPALSQNQLLAALPAHDSERWMAQLQPVQLKAGQVLIEAGRAPASVYFPTTAIISLLYTTADGNSSEYAVVGNDGLVGISAFMGGAAMPGEAVVQTAGAAWRMPAATVRDDCLAWPSVLRLMLTYTQAVLTQVAHTAACNRYHSIEQLLCRRLLLGLERSSGSSLFLTQEAVANLLGVRRESVTGAALKLQRAGVIRYSRGQIAVLDRSELEARSRQAPEPAHAGRAPRQLRAQSAA